MWAGSTLIVLICILIVWHLTFRRRMASSVITARFPSVFVTHGGGPLPVSAFHNVSFVAMPVLARTMCLHASASAHALGTPDIVPASATSITGQRARM